MENTEDNKNVHECAISKEWVLIKLVPVWKALHKQTQGQWLSGDPLNQNERITYENLTQQFGGIFENGQN